MARRAPASSPARLLAASLSPQVTAAVDRLVEAGVASAEILKLAARVGRGGLLYAAVRAYLDEIHGLKRRSPRIISPRILPFDPISR